MTNNPRAIAPLAWRSAATLTLPGSKSEANRLLVAAALSNHEVTVHGATASDDVRHLVHGLATLGYAARFVNEAEGTVAVGPRNSTSPGKGELFCGNAGTALRFLVSVAAITPGEWTVTGDAHMQRRPVQPLVDAWQALGVVIDATDGCPPVHVHGSTPRGGQTTIDTTVSSQFVSSLLLVGAALPEGLHLTFTGDLASRDYAHLTHRLLQRFGIECELTDDHARVRPGYGDVPSELRVGGDWSAMGVWTCLNHLTGSRITAPERDAGSGQPDERLADLLAALLGDGDRTVDVAAMPDQFMNLAVVAALRGGTTRLTGAANVRVKECDRIAVMARELQKIGVDLDEHPDGLTVRGGRPLRPATIDPEADHRIAMAFALCGLLSPGIAIADPDCVAKSYPGFWRDLQAVRDQHVPVAIVGMRGAGKTTLARALAERTGSTFIDTDQLFEHAHGPIARFVERDGWPAFRHLEERIVEQALQPGAIVATGGGAVESASTRALLRERAHVIWLRADEALLRGRLTQDGSRPSLTGKGIVAELGEVLQRRTPLYTEVADRHVDASQPIERQIEACLSSSTRPAPSGEST